MTAKPPKSASWMPPAWELADAKSIQQLAAGDATPDQQKRALRFIVESLCGTYDMSYRPESDRDTCFAEGRRFVGNQIVKLTKIDLPALQRAKPKSTTKE